MRPNIIFILTDQMRGDCLSVLDHPVVDTPYLDQLARTGTLFTRAYASCPSCIAARASIFTGLTPSGHGRLGYRDEIPWEYDDMLPEVLSRAGYQTHCVGKTHFYPQRKHCGFDSLESYEGLQGLTGGFVNDYHEWLREKTGRPMADTEHGLNNNAAFTARPSPLPEELHNNTWVVTRGLEFIRRRDPTRPFFLNLSFHRPHPPIDPPQAFYDMYADRPLPELPMGDWAHAHDVPVNQTDSYHGRAPKRQIDNARRAYYAQIAHIDAQLGRLLLALRVLKPGPTAFVFTSDHGEMLGDHLMYRKTYAYEGSARVPMIVNLPREMEPMPGRTIESPSVLEDIYPTVLDIAGVPVPGRTEGKSLAPWCLGDDPDDWYSYVHGEHSACYDEAEAMQFLTDGREKYIWFTVTGHEQLFDIASDPDERIDRAKDPAWHNRLATWRRRLIDRLAPREQDGLTDGRELKSGVKLPPVRPGTATLNDS